MLEETRRLRAVNGSLSSRVATQRVEFVRQERQAQPSNHSTDFHGLKGDSAPMRRLCALLGKAAVTDIPVLLRGETGTGKDLAARAIHQLSLRRGGPFVTETLSSIPQGLLESELFGYVQGAFSGAVGDRTGLLAAADGGTLYLADIGELSLEVQAKIVRVLESGEVRPLGGPEGRHVDFRLITSTQRDLHREVAAGRFRNDLLFRVQGVELVLPPLRERPEDIPLLIDHFLKVEAGRLGPQHKLDADALK